MAEAATQSRLEQLSAKYGVQSASNPRAEAHQTFDLDSAYRTDRAALGRISRGPKVKDGTATGEIHAEMAAIQLDLADLAETYGKLNVKFKTLMGSGKLYTAGEAVSIAFNSLLQRRQRVREVKMEAAKRKGDGIEYLIDRMGEVLQDQYQKAVQGKANAQGLQRENLAHMKNLDRRLIQNLREGVVKTSDHISAGLEVRKLENELSEIDQMLAMYEKDVQDAQTKGDLPQVSKITDEMSQVLEIKHGVLDGRLAAEGVVSEIRRQVLNAAEGVQSAKGAIAASKVNYQAINALIDAMNELEIKYRHAQSDMIPVFHVQGKIASLGTGALDMKDTLLRVADISQRLMETNAKLVTHLAAETFELLRTPLYDPERAGALEQQIRTYMTQLNDMKMEWAKAQQRVTEQPESPHYARPQ